MSAVPILAGYDAQPLRRYVNPSFHPALLWPCLEEVLGESTYLLCLLHPDEAVPRDNAGHPLIAYSPRIVLENIRRIAAACTARGRRPAFMTLREFAELRCGAS